MKLALIGEVVQAPVAQLVEQLTLNHQVHGSSPCRSTKRLCMIAQSYWGSIPSGETIRCN